MSRAVAPVVAVVLLTALTVSIAATVGAVVATQPAEPAPIADLRLSVDASADRLTIRHAGGDALNPASIRVRVRIDGHPLAHQPPVPFFAAQGFRSGPTGPFNPATGGEWTAGETATLQLASTNAPLIDGGDRVRVMVATDSAVVATMEATAA